METICKLIFYYVALAIENTKIITYFLSLEAMRGFYVYEGFENNDWYENQYWDLSNKTLESIIKNQFE